MIFGASQQVTGIPETLAETATKRVMQRIWAAFANDPQNGLKRLGLPTYDAKSESFHKSIYAL